MINYTNKVMVKENVEYIYLVMYVLFKIDKNLIET